MKIKNDEDFGSVLVCAVRYALGRRTYMPSIVVGFIRPIAGELSIKTLTTIRNDIRTAKERGMLGDSNIDAPVWLDLLRDCDFFLSGGVRAEKVTPIGDRIRAVRKKSNMTQKDLAAKCGVCSDYISKIEVGKIEPKPDIILIIAQSLGVSVEYLTTQEKDA